jgi:N-acetylglucosamine malate deacetylase 1
MSRLLILAAHPDELETTIAGTVTSLVRADWNITAGVFTNTEYDSGRAESMRKAAYYSASVLGHDLYWVLDGRHQRVEEIAENQLVGLV